MESDGGYSSESNDRYIVENTTSNSNEAIVNKVEDINSNVVISKKRKSINEDKDKDKDKDKGKGKEPSKSNSKLVWTKPLEINLLEGMTSFYAQNPSASWDDKEKDALYKSLKGCFDFDVRKEQLRKKIARLKKKYESHLEQYDNKNFIDEHDKKLFDLSYRLWGVDHQDAPLCERCHSEVDIDKLLRLELIGKETADKLKLSKVVDLIATYKRSDCIQDLVLLKINFGN